MHILLKKLFKFSFFTSNNIPQQPKPRYEIWAHLFSNYWESLLVVILRSMTIYDLNKEINTVYLSIGDSWEGGKGKG